MGQGKSECVVLGKLVKLQAKKIINSALFLISCKKSQIKILKDYNIRPKFINYISKSVENSPKIKAYVIFMDETLLSKQIEKNKQIGLH